jgi:hypothetical protein
MSDSRYLDRYSTNIDAILFVAVFFAGVVVQLIARVVLDLSALLVTLVLVGLLCFYFWLIILNTATKQVNDRAGDNLYFLGFIFTALTFGVALYKIGGDPDLPIGTVLGDLGIGLTTTLLGLVLRVVCSLLRTGTEEIEDIVHSNLKQQAEQLEKRFARASQLAEKTNTLTQQLLKETNDTLENVVTRNRQELEAIYTNTFEEIKQLIEKSKDSYEKLYKKIDNINVPEDFIVKKLSESFASFESMISNANTEISSFADHLGQRLQADQVTIASVTEGIKQLHQEVEKLATTISNQNIDTQGIERVIAKSSEIYSDSVKALTEKLGKVDVPVNVLSEPIINTMEMYSNSVKALTEKLDNVDVPVNALSDPIQNAITQSTESYSAAVRGLSDKITALSVPENQVETTLKTIFEDTNQTLSNKNLEDYESLLGVASESLEKQTRQLDQKVKDLNGALESLSTQVLNIASKLEETSSRPSIVKRIFGR